MSFASPYLLVGLLVVPLAVWGYRLSERRRVRQAAVWASPALLPNMLNSPPGRRRHVPAVFFLVGLTLLLVGFARPQATVSSAQKGSTVVLTIDVSGSMASGDLRPTRLKAVSAAAIAFLRALPGGYRVALVTFSDHVTVLVPPTTDHKRIITALPHKSELEGTAIGDAVTRSVAVAVRAVGRSRPGAPHPPAAVLLFSDGAQNTGRVEPSTAATNARRAGVPISTVSVGTSTGIVKQKLPGGYSERIAVPVAPTTLRAVARSSGGRFFRTLAPEQLKQVYEDLGSRTAHERVRREVTTVAVGAALAFILGGAVVSALWFQRPI